MLGLASPKNTVQELHVPRFSSFIGGNNAVRAASTKCLCFHNISSCVPQTKSLLIPAIHRVTFH